MSSNDKFYAKLKLHPKHKLLGSFVLTPEKQYALAWTGKVKKNERADEEAETKSPTPFQVLTRDFLASNVAFHRAIPVCLRWLPEAINLQYDEEVRGLLKDQAHLLDDSNGFELYEVPSPLFGELRRRGEKHSAIRSGAAHLPEMFLMGLVSSYDAFLAKLMRETLVAKKDAINSSGKTLTLKELLDIGSVEQAREHVLSAIVDENMRASHDDQIGWFEKCLQAKIKPGAVELWPAYIELFERRNLLTHTGGVVSQQYLSKCKEHKALLEGVELGVRLRVDPTYLKRSIDLLLEFGIKLSQFTWRKLLREEAAIADDELSLVGYRLIEMRRFKLASRVLKFGLNDVTIKADDAARKRMIVNYANAVKLGGDKEAALSIVGAEDWSSTSVKYKICVAAIRDETENVISMMKDASAADDGISAAEFRDWPVFETVRAQPEFQQAFHELFKQPLTFDTTIKGSEEKPPESEQAKGGPEPT